MNQNTEIQTEVFVGDFKQLKELCDTLAKEVMDHLPKAKIEVKQNEIDTYKIDINITIPTDIVEIKFLIKP